jgi:hypothetical protein
MQVWMAVARQRFSPTAPRMGLIQPHFQLPDPQHDPLVQLLALSRRTNELLEHVVALLQAPRQDEPLQQTLAPLTDTAGPCMAAMLQDLEVRRANHHTLSEEAHTVHAQFQNLSMLPRVLAAHTDAAC